MRTMTSTTNRCTGRPTGDFLPCPDERRRCAAAAAAAPAAIDGGESMTSPSATFFRYAENTGGGSRTRHRLVGDRVYRPLAERHDGRVHLLLVRALAVVLPGLLGGRGLGDRGLSLGRDLGLCLALDLGGRSRGRRRGFLALVGFSEGRLEGGLALLLLGAAGRLLCREEGIDRLNPALFLGFLVRALHHLGRHREGGEGGKVVITGKFYNFRCS